MSEDEYLAKLVATGRWLLREEDPFISRIKAGASIPLEEAIARALGYQPVDAADFIAKATSLKRELEAARQVFEHFSQARTAAQLGALPVHADPKGLQSSAFGRDVEGPSPAWRDYVDFKAFLAWMASKPAEKANYPYLYVLSNAAFGEEATAALFGKSVSDQGKWGFSAWIEADRPVSATPAKKKPNTEVQGLSKQVQNLSRVVYAMGVEWYELIPNTKGASRKNTRISVAESMRSDVNKHCGSDLGHTPILDALDEGAHLLEINLKRPYQKKAVES